MINSQLKMMGRQLESEEVREVVFGEHGNQNELRLQLTVIIIPTEVSKIFPMVSAPFLNATHSF
jgi:hypothetical protein